MSDPKTGVSNEKNKRDDNVSNQDVGAPCSVVTCMQSDAAASVRPKGKNRNLKTDSSKVSKTGKQPIKNILLSHIWNTKLEWIHKEFVAVLSMAFFSGFVDGPLGGGIYKSD